MTKIYPEEQYLNTTKDILLRGSRQKNRTNIDTFMIPGAMMQFDLSQKFTAAVTTKKLAYNAVKGELIGFLRGYTSAAQFRELGCKIWDQNANENAAWLANPYRKGEDDLGYIYSRLWTDMPDGTGAWQYSHDPAMERWNQIEKLIEAIRQDPRSRRLIVSSWHPEVFHLAALPPCHVLFQVIIDQETGQMHMTMYQRSCDMFLGVPFNLASYGTLLHMICVITGYFPGTLTWFGADCHIYENHIEQVMEQLSREPLEPPTLKINREVLTPEFTIDQFSPQDIELVDYKHHGPLKAPMAV